MRVAQRTFDLQSHISCNPDLGRQIRIPGRYFRHIFASLALSIMLLPNLAQARFNAYFQATPNPNDGNYTLSWNSPSGRVYLQERVNGGSWSGVAGGLSLSSPLTFTDKQPGIYEYRLEWVYLDCPNGGRTRRDCNYVTEYSNTKTVTVEGPPAESFSDQLEYQYEIRSGDFDGNGYTDILVDRMTPGEVDGSMQTVVIEAGAGGLTTVVPTQSELGVARSYPKNPNLKLGGSDRNFDGYADLLIVGLRTLNTPIYEYDCIIMYASAVSGVARPSGLQFIDEEFTEFFVNIAQAVADPLFYVRNTSVTLRPVFELEIECPFQLGSLLPTSLWNCYIGYTFAGFEFQVTGIGYHPDAPSATAAMDAIEAGDYSNGDPWKQLSDAMENVMGVNSFGYLPNGSRQPTNYHKDGDEVEDEFQEIRDAYTFQVLLSIRYDKPPPPVPPELWPRHEYDVGEPGVGTSICSTTSDTVYHEDPRGPISIFGPTIRTIPAAICTLDNVFCWAKRRPAPRQNQSQATITSGEPSVLYGWNPIMTHVFENERVLVNETMGDTVIDGREVSAHKLHDPLQRMGCAAQANFGDINENEVDHRCSYLHREVYMLGSGINIRTHGEGHNEPPMDTINEVVGGEVIFPEVDEWIRRRLATDGACMDDP